MPSSNPNFDSCDQYLRSIVGSGSGPPQWLQQQNSGYSLDAFPDAFDSGFDFDVLSGPPPALLPSGAISFASCTSSLEPLPAQISSPRALVSTPTMHPNLVNTLKVMLSESPTSSSDISSVGGGSGCISEASSRRYINKRRHDVMQLDSPLFQDEYCLPVDQYYCSRFTGERGARGDDEAAVVPVDLIQNRRPFKCAYQDCTKTFKNPQTMRMHHKTHYSDDRAHRLTDVNAHVMSTFRAGHNKKIPSRCPVCRKTFVGLYEVRRHYGRKHTVGEKQFGCKKCPKKFYIEVDLRDHEKLCGNLIECKCGMKFAFKCNLVAHKKAYPKCQDPPTEGTQTKNGRISKQQQRQTRSRIASRSRISSTARAPVASPEAFSSMSSSPSISELASAWTPVSPCSEELSSYLSTDDLCFSPDRSYLSGTSPNSTGFSSQRSFSESFPNCFYEP